MTLKSFSYFLSKTTFFCILAPKIEKNVFFEAN